jgi:hypothetical protein
MYEHEQYNDPVICMISLYLHMFYNKKNKVFTLVPHVLLR